MWWQDTTGGKVWRVSPLWEHGQRVAKGKGQVGRRKNLHVWSLDQCTQHKHWLRHPHTFLLLAPLLPGNCRLAAECLAWSVEPSSEQMLGQRKVISTGKWLQALWFGQRLFSPHRADLQLMPQGLRCLCSLWHLFKLHWGKSWSCWSCGSSFRFGSSQGLSTPTRPLLISPALHCQPLQEPLLSCPRCSGRRVFKGHVPCTYLCLHLALTPLRSCVMYLYCRSQPQYCRCCF